MIQGKFHFFNVPIYHENVYFGSHICETLVKLKNHCTNEKHYYCYWRQTWEVFAWHSWPLWNMQRFRRTV